MLFARLGCVLFSRLERSVKEVLTVALSACAVGLLITKEYEYNITGPTNARIQPGYKLNCTQQVEVDGLNGTIPCSNYPTLLTQHGLTTMIF